jgi:hypothetical protein
MSCRHDRVSKVQLCISMEATEHIRAIVDRARRRTSPPRRRRRRRRRRTRCVPPCSHVGGLGGQLRVEGVVCHALLQVQQRALLHLRARRHVVSELVQATRPMPQGCRAVSPTICLY